MVMGEQDFLGRAAETRRELRLLPEPLPEPFLEGPAERGQSPGKLAELRREDSIELAERLFVEHDVIDLVDADPGLVETETRRLDRQVGIVLDPTEPLLFRGSDH